MSNINDKKTKLIITIIIILFLILLIILWNFLFRPEKKIIVINGQKITLEIANNSYKMQKGLAYRNYLPENYGMLFIFNKEGKYSFTMDNMKFSLDFIWLKDNQVVDIKENVSISEHNILSTKFFNKVIELNSESIKKLNILVGTEIKI